MSNLEETLSSANLRFLIYGPAKARKTWWAATAAEAGFNVILLNADNNLAVLKNLKAEAKKRISVVNIYDAATKARCSVFLTALLRQKAFVWDNTQRTLVNSKSAIKKDSSHFIIDPTKLTPNDVVVMDSWTKNAHSLLVRYCNENGINLAEAEEEDNKWDGFRWMKAVAEWQLNQFQILKCHVIVVGHQQVFEKSRHEKQGNRNVKVVEWQRTQPISTSGPAAMQLASHFTDILYFTISGEMTRIDSKPSKDRDGGSTVVPPAQYEFHPGNTKLKNVLAWDRVCKFAGITPPVDVEPSQAFRYFPAGSEVPYDDITPGVLRTNQQIIKKAEEKKVIESSSKPTTLAGLASK